MSNVDGFIAWPPGNKSRSARSLFTNPSLQSNATNTTVNQVASDYINFIVPPILIVIGVTCNIFTILIMRSKYFHNISTSVYLKVAAFNDIIGLSVLLTAHWLYVNFPWVYIRTDSSHAMCKFFNFTGSGITDLGMLITATMTVERAIAIASPLGAIKHCSVKRARTTVCGLLVVVFFKNCHYLFSSDIVPEDRNDRLCDVRTDKLAHAYTVFWVDVYPWINLSYVAICALMIAVSNVVLLRSVRHSVADRHIGGHRTRHLLPMLVGESVLLMILTFPFTIHTALLAIRLKYDPSIYTDVDKAATENLVFSVTFYMLYANKCANFFMFCVTGSKFRKVMRDLLVKCVKQSESIGARGALSMSMTISTVFTKTFSRSKHPHIRASSENSELSSSDGQHHSDHGYYGYIYEETQPSVTCYL